MVLPNSLNMKQGVEQEKQISKSGLGQFLTDLKKYELDKDLVNILDNNVKNVNLSGVDSLKNNQDNIPDIDIEAVDVLDILKLGESNLNNLRKNVQNNLLDNLDFSGQLPNFVDDLFSVLNLKKPSSVEVVDVDNNFVDDIDNVVDNGISIVPQNISNSQIIEDNQEEYRKTMVAQMGSVLNDLIVDENFLNALQSA